MATPSLQRQFRNFYYTFASSSLSAIVANCINIASRVYQWAFSALLGFKPEAALRTGYPLWLFIAGIIYSGAHSVVMSFSPATSSRWSIRDNQIALHMAMSIDRLREQTGRIDCNPVACERYIQGILIAIRYEIERWVVESAGLYINVSLLVEDPDDSSRLVVLGRANPDRLNRSYPKDRLYAWRLCWRLKKTHYVGNFNDPEKPYKSILSIPLKIQDINGNIQVVGVISIDSSKPHHFEGLDSEIESKLVPELSLLKLVLG